MSEVNETASAPPPDQQPAAAEDDAHKTDAKAPSTPPQQQQKHAVHHHRSGMQQDDSAEDDDEPHEKQRSSLLPPPPPKGKKKASPYAAQPYATPGGKKKKKKPTSSSSPAAARKDDGGNDLPPVVHKSPASNTNTNNRRKSLTFEKKVATHQFRDLDQSSPNVKTNPHPKELTTDRAENLRVPKSKHSDKNRRQSVAFEVKATKHEFREVDTKLPAMNTRVATKSSSPQGRDDDHHGGGGNSGSTQRRRSMAFENKVAKHQFRDLDQDDKKNSTFNAKASPRDGPVLKEIATTPRDKSDAAIQQKVAQHQFRDLDSTHNSITSGGSGGTNGQMKDEFYVDARPHPLPSVFDTPEEREKRRQEERIVEKVKQHTFRDFDPDDTLPPFVTKSRSNNDKEETAKKAQKIREYHQHSNTKKHDSNEQHTTAKTARPISDRVAALATAKKTTTTTATSHTARTKSSSDATPPKKKEKKEMVPSPPKEEKTSAADHHPHRPMFTGVPAEESTLTTASAKSGAGGGDDDDDTFKPLKRGASNTGSSSGSRVNSFAASSPRRKSTVSLPTAEEKHVDVSFPRQPKCDPDNLDVPTTRIMDLLWDRYVIGDKKYGLFPADKFMVCYGKIWPGHKITEDMQEQAIDSIVDDRDKQQQKKASAAAAADQSTKTTDEAAAAPEVGGDDQQHQQQRRRSSGDSAQQQQQHEEVEVPSDLVTHKEFLLTFKIISTINNWNVVLDPLPPKVLSVEDFAPIADQLKIEKPGKLFMELTDMTGDALPYGKLAKHFAEKKKSGLSLHLLAKTRSWTKKHHSGAVGAEESGVGSADHHDHHQDDSDNEHSNQDHQHHVEKIVFPRQPRCDPEDLTLPTTRILGLLYDKYSASNADKLFPLSKLPLAISKIWPGHTIPTDSVDDAIDVVLADRSSSTTAKEEDKKGEQEQEEEQSKDTCGNAEYIMCFRVVANLNNWRTILAPDTPKLLDIETFAIVADRLRVEPSKIAKLFMELTSNGQKGMEVPQATLALYFSKKKKTFRSKNFNNNEADDEEQGELSDNEDELGASNNKLFSPGSRRGSKMSLSPTTNNTGNNRKPSFSSPVVTASAAAAAKAKEEQGGKQDKTRDFDSRKANTNNSAFDDDDGEIGLPGEKKKPEEPKKKSNMSLLEEFDEEPERPPTPPPPPVNDTLKQLKDLLFPTEMFAIKASFCSFAPATTNVKISQADFNSTIDSLVQCGAVRQTEMEKAKQIIIATTTKKVSSDDVDITAFIDCLNDKNDYVREAEEYERAAVKKSKERTSGIGGRGRFVPAKVRMFSGCKDDQTSADVADVAKFNGLQAVTGAAKAGGACTNALLSILKSDSDITYGELLGKMLDVLKEKQYTQIPQLSSSDPVDLNEEKFCLIADKILPPSPSSSSSSSTTTKKQQKRAPRIRALFVGVNYTGQDPAVVLDGCANDALSWRKYLKANGWPDDADHMRLLTDGSAVTADDNVFAKPTRAEILSGMDWLVSDARAGDVLFFHFSGHGSQLPSRGPDNDEEDGMDETLVPCDYESKGEIRDDETFQRLLMPLPPGVKLDWICDCCHSGSGGELEYTTSADPFTLEAISSGRLLTTLANPKFVSKKLEQAADLVKEGFEAVGDFFDKLF